MWDRRAKVLAVKDGDTLRVVLDQGFGDAKTIDLRLLDTWAPEKDEPGGPETREYVETWLNEHDPDGDEWPFVVTVDRNRAGTREVVTFGRYVGTLTAFDGYSILNEDVNAFVASMGYGHGIGAAS
jgi:endonuclease YncB( thermonuclease family)